MPTFLKTKQTQIVLNGQSISLRGVNLGGWLMMEGYIMHALNIAEQVFKKNFAKTLGQAKLKEFERDFRANFITEEDFKNVAGLGFNCLRVPFNYRLIKPGERYDKEGLAILDQVLAWAQKYKLWIIWDLHAAPGAQNYDWHSDSLGKAKLWTGKTFQNQTFAIWEFLADRYKDNPWVAGYDVLNEAVVTDIDLLNKFYAQVIKTIRRVDPNHIIFIEGNNYAQDITCLADFDDNNLALSIHYYAPIEFTFNLIPHLTYQESFSIGQIRSRMEDYKKIAEKWSRPIFVGEWGVNYRQGKYGEDLYVKDAAQCFNDVGFHWTYWTYKAIKNAAFPDGIYSYRNNPLWVNRQGPKIGWDNYAQLWKTQRREIVESWRTTQFTPNIELLNVLSGASK
jgi:aryl-phospho-beta-D-glucosidase BglC (GH1 family)